MLVLSRGVGERIQIGEQIEITVVRISPGVVRIGVEAPGGMSVMRQEIIPSNLKENCLPASESANSYSAD
jgi:carbon storage regulator